MRKLSISVLAFLLLGSTASLALGETSAPDEQWVQPMKYDDGWKALTLDETTVRETSRLVGTVNDPKTNLTVEQSREKYFCKDALAEECKKFFTLEFGATLPVCDSIITTNCLESFYGTKANGERVEGVFQKYSESTPFAFPAHEKYGIPAGAYPSLWKLPGIANSSGAEDYILIPYAYGSTKHEKWQENPAFTYHQIVASVYAVKAEAGSRYRPIYATDASTSPSKIVGSSNSGNNMCAAQDIGLCYMRYPLPTDVQLGMTLRLNTTFEPWIHGRVADPNISITSLGSDGSRIDVSGTAMRISNLGTWARVETLTPEIREWILNDDHENGGVGLWENHRSLTKTFAYNIGVSGEGNIRQLKMWLPVLGDKASANPTTWSFRFLESRELSEANKCIKSSNQLAGFVSTNASVYSAGPPVYNSATGSLDYTVIAPHFDATGKEFLGTYDLLIRDSVARCIYGFSDAPIKAEISIVSEDGTNKVSTNTITKKGEWIALSAKGFTYSTPTIRVKLSQTPVEAQQSTVNSTQETKAAAPVTTIKPKSLKKIVTCAKGKVVRKISGLNPKCPSGYKLVRP